MEFKKETRPLSQVDADTLVIFVFQDELIETELKTMDAAFPGDFISAVNQECARENFTGKPTQAVQLPTYGKLAAKRLVIKGAGKRAAADTATMRRATASVARRMSSGTAIDTIAVHVPSVTADQALAQAVIEGWLLGCYQFKKYKTSADDKKHAQTRQLVILNSPLNDEQFQHAAFTAATIAQATNMARDMVAEPPDYMTPSKLAEIASGLSGDRLT